MSLHPATPPSCASVPVELRRPALLGETGGPGAISDAVAGLVEGRAPRWWRMAMGVSVATLLLCGVMVAYLLNTGVGVWGVRRPVMWGWDIVNFVWWIGIGHAGTLISAMLYLLRQRWRTSINRATEAMTLFAVLCAALYPAIHVGRAWFVWWLLPVPTSQAIWPQFHSPLVWDIFAVGTYFSVSVLFWYAGLIPDLATLRDRATTRWRKRVYGGLALGWRGSNRHWCHYEKTYLILAGLAAALVVSVHSIVSLDFAATQLPGWHSTIFPPYFVVGAIFSGCGMVLTLLIPLRRLCRLETLITLRHFDLLTKVTLATGLLVAYSHLMEWAGVVVGGNPDERFAHFNRACGPLAWAYWIMVAGALVVPQLLWSRRVRANLKLLFGIGLCLNVGMWFERLVIVVTSLQRDFLPSSWGNYAPTWVEMLTFLGSFGLFATLFLLFVRYLPLVAIAEVKGLTPQADPAAEGTVPARLVQEPSPPVPHGGATPAPAPSGTYGILAQFRTARDLVEAARRVRQAGYQRWDTAAPFPIHGLDRAMGLANSAVGWFSFAGGAMGAGAGLLMVWWLNGHLYPLPVGGKPFFSVVTAFLPAYELAILCAALGALLGMLALNRLPGFGHPLLRHRSFGHATHDGFFLVIEAADPKFAAAETRALLENAGGTSVEWVAPSVPAAPLPFAICHLPSAIRRWRFPLLASLLVLLSAVGVLGLRGRFFRSPPLELLSDLKRQPRLNPQAGSAFFADGRGSRPLVEGTVPRSDPWPVGGAWVYPHQEHPFTTGRLAGKTNWIETSPVPLTAALLQRGWERFQIHCAPCHGALGSGNGIVLRLGMGVVANLHDKRIVLLPDGEVFHTVTQGKNLMQSYAADLDPADRWAVVACVRMLQLSHLGSTNDLSTAVRSQLDQQPAMRTAPDQL